MPRPALTDAKTIGGTGARTLDLDHHESGEEPNLFQGVRAEKEAHPAHRDRGAGGTQPLAIAVG